MILQSKENQRVIKKVMQEFSNATGLASIFVNIQGIEVTDFCNFTPFCKRMREDPKTHLLCQKCDLFGGLESTKFAGTAHIYKCHAELIDFSVPIIIEDQLVAFFVSGQVRCEDENAFDYIIPKSNWRKDLELVAAYNAVPILSAKQIIDSAELLRILSNYYLKTKIIKANVPIAERTDNQANEQVAKEFLKNKEVEKALTYIHNNLNKSLTLEEVASHVHLSSFYFSKLFKKETGKNFIHYINEKKMELAKEMLVNTSLSVDIISNNLGFSHTSYFCKVFRNKYKTTPKNYRESAIIQTPPTPQDCEIGFQSGSV